jgi:hypothetical protein
VRDSGSLTLVHVPHLVSSEHGTSNDGSLNPGIDDVMLMTSLLQSAEDCANTRYLTEHQRRSVLRRYISQTLKERLRVKCLTSSKSSISRTKSRKERHNSPVDIVQKDLADQKGDRDKIGTTNACLGEFLEAQSDGFEIQNTTSGDIGELLEVVEDNLLDGVDEIADSKLLDESPEVLGGNDLSRELGVGHDW